MSDRVAVFIDYQNTYNSARRTFHSELNPPYTCGQFWPDLLGKALASDAPPGFERHLDSVHVYRGVPDSSKDPKGYGACRKQVAAWEKQGGGLVHVHTRPLRYPRGWPDDVEPGDLPGEKGVDVQLAIDMAMMAVRREYEIGILVSVDTDLRPVLEAISDFEGSIPRAEVAAWSNTEQHCRRLSVPGRRIFCHWVDEQTYLHMRDDTNYTR